MSSSLALAGAPEQPFLRAVRGQILVKLGRHAEARLDLEAAQAGLPDDRGVRQVLEETDRLLTTHAARGSAESAPGRSEPK